MTTLMAFLPELVLLGGALGLFVVTLGENRGALARTVALLTAALVLVTSVASLCQNAVLFDGAYRVDAFSQWLKVAISVGFLAVVALQRGLPDIRDEVRAEYYLFLALSLTGLMLLVSAIDLVALVIALELSSFPLYLMVAMRRERDGHRVQMESAIKYMMFGVAANGVMFFGMSYLYGLTGSLSLPVMMERLPAQMGSPLAVAGLAMTFAGLFYKLAVFPFHFWTPDVYQGSSNETAGFIASLPKLGAVAVFARFAQLATPGQPTLVLLLSILAGASMFYGNLIALGQSDLKRLLGFSGIAHAGYAMVGFVALEKTGSAAALFYIAGYVLMVLACFVVISHVSRDGENVAISELAGLHKRSPLLAVTLGVGLFALAGLPPFVGFMGKLGLLTAALSKGHLAIVVIAVINSAIAIYYYLNVIRVAVFGDKGPEAEAAAPIVLGWSSRLLCVGLIIGIVLLGVAPAKVLAAIAASL